MLQMLHYANLIVFQTVMCNKLQKKFVTSLLHSLQVCYKNPLPGKKITDRMIG